jgi:hypothetical protein
VRDGPTRRARPTAGAARFPRRVSARGTTLLAAAVSLAGCAGLGGVRPYYGPVPGSVTLLFTAAPDAVTRAAAAEAQQAGLVVQWLSPEEGYVETQWFNVTTHASTPAPDLGDLDHCVKIRFFADPTAGKTRLAAEAVTAYAVDPSRPQRELERMAPEGHPGREVLTQLLDRLKTRFPNPTDTTGARR